MLFRDQIEPVLEAILGKDNRILIVDTITRLIEEGIVEKDKRPDMVISYLGNNGSYCPYCGSPTIEGHGFSVENGKAYQEIYCVECEAGWDDEYTLSGIVEKDRGKRT